MFTGFGKKIEKIKAKVLDKTIPEYTDTRIKRVEDEEKAYEERKKMREEKRIKENKEKELRKINATTQLRQELSKEISRENSYANSSINSKVHEKILSKNDPENNAKTLGGSFGSSLTKLKDDGYGVFKPYDTFELPERKLQIQNERAAYLVDLFLGFDLVPPTVIRELKDPNDNSDQIGSMQQFIEDAAVGDELEDAGKNDIDSGEIAKLAIYDFMIKNTDRHHANYLVKDRKVYAIDHGLCFASRVAYWREDEKETPAAILSSDYYNLQHRSTLFDEGTFWDLELPKENLEKLKAFNVSSKDQAIFHQLLQELIGVRKAELFLHRITSIITALDDKGKLNQKILRKTLNDIFFEKYHQGEITEAA